MYRFQKEENFFHKEGISNSKSLVRCLEFSKNGNKTRLIEAGLTSMRNIGVKIRMVTRDGGIEVLGLRGCHNNFSFNVQEMDEHFGVFWAKK